MYKKVANNIDLFIVNTPTLSLLSFVQLAIKITANKTAIFKIEFVFIF